MAKQIPIADFCKSLSYDPASGDLVWRVSLRGPVKKGMVAGTICKSGYRSVELNGQKYFAHRVIWEMHKGPIPDGMEIDHINGNRADNRLKNLRLATHGQNQANSRRRRQLPKGVSFSRKKMKPYKAEIKKDGRSHHLGHFACPTAAHAAYCEAAAKYHGDFARFK